MTTPWNAERIIAELLRDHTGPQTPATIAARRYLGAFEDGARQIEDATRPTVAGSATIAMTARIAILVQQATLIAGGQVADDLDAWEALADDVRQLDRDAGTGLAVGRFLRFQVAESEAEYLIDRIEGERVHVQWLPNADERWADAVDSEGYVLRSVAAAQLARRDRRAAWGIGGHG
jgi:hypothetical protein